jgi:hypothetical protein
MRKIFTILTAVLLTVSIFAQSPEKMSYQAVIRNSSGQIVVNQAIGMQISILQGSVTGTAVYAETQTPSTNAGGLVSIEIGDGTVVSGNFVTIDWANGLYFIKTEIDPAGGTNYSITGTSQLLSVPYALHAKTAETVTGTITESDPVYTGSQAANITATDITNLGNLSGVNTGNQDLSGLATKTALGDSTSKIRSEIPSVSGFLKSESDPVFNTSVAKQITASDTAKWTASIHKIGDSYGGGIVFYVDATGQHGLVAATADLSTGIQWNNGTNTTTNAMRDGIGAGMYNTEGIIVNQGAGYYAATICASYQGGGYGDWYLPSKYELNLLYLQKDVVGGFTFAYYWSSTEYNNNGAWIQYFNNGAQGLFDKGYGEYMRAIRAF